MDKKIFNNINTSSRSPGPAAYSLKTTIGKLATDPSIKKDPAYSILGSRKTKINGYDNPGPIYNTSQMNHTGKSRTPGGILGSLLPKKNKPITPSPIDYTIGSTLISSGPKMREDVGRHRHQDLGPAPNAYCIPNSFDGRAVRLNDWFPMPAQSPTPGPGQYIIPHGDLYLPGRYRGGRTIGKKFSPPYKVPLPGPTDYDGRIQPTNRSDKRICRTTFGIRRPDTEPVFAIPADNEDLCC